MDTHPVAKLSYVRRCAIAAVAVVAAAGLLTMAGSAGAQPQPTVSQVQAKLKKLTYKENWLVQRYDQASQNLASARQRLGVVNTEVSKDAAAARSMQDQIAQIASNVYENGAMSSVAALLTSGNPQTLLSQSAFLTHLSTDQYQQLQQVITTERQLAGARQMAKRTEQAVAALKKQLGSQRAAAEQDHHPAEGAAGQPDPAATAAAARRRRDHHAAGAATPDPRAPRPSRRWRSPTTSSAARTSSVAPGRAAPGSTAPG